MFTIDTETGFRDAVLINASYGLGENVVQGSVNPDEYYVFKPTLKTGRRPILQKTARHQGVQAGLRRRRRQDGQERPRRTRGPRRASRITDDEILAARALGLRDRGSLQRQAGRPVPMDIEWAKDGLTGELFIVQARPETVAVAEAARFDRDLPSACEGPRARHRAKRRREDRPRTGARDQERAGPPAVQGGRGARHRQDRPRLGADHEEGRGDRHEPRRPDLPRRDRQPRARAPGGRRHRARHRAA